MTKVLQYSGLISFALLIGWIYYTYNPLNHSFFPQCPLRLATGYECPGCGSQRALHSLLNGQWAEAFAFNPLLIISLPYLLVGFSLEIPQLRRRAPKLRHYAFGYWGSIFWAIVAILFWIGRNLV